VEGRLTPKKLGREGVDIFQTDAWNKNKLKKLRMGLKSLPVIAAYLFLITRTALVCKM